MYLFAPCFISTCIFVETFIVRNCSDILQCLWKHALSDRLISLLFSKQQPFLGSLFRTNVHCRILEGIILVF